MRILSGRACLVFLLLLAAFTSAPFGSIEQPSYASEGWLAGADLDPPTLSARLPLPRRALREAPAPAAALPAPSLLPLPVLAPAPRGPAPPRALPPPRPRRLSYDALAPPRA